MCTTNEAQMRTHQENKHPDSTVHDCFPDKFPA